MGNRSMHRVNDVHVCCYIIYCHSPPWTFLIYSALLSVSVQPFCSFKSIICNPSGWRLQPMRILRTLVSPPPVLNRHVLEPYGRWHRTIYIKLMDVMLRMIMLVFLHESRTIKIVNAIQVQPNCLIEPSTKKTTM